MNIYIPIVMIIKEGGWHGVAQLRIQHGGLLVALRNLKPLDSLGREHRSHVS